MIMSNSLKRQATYFLKTSLLYVSILFQSACSVIGIRDAEEAEFSIIKEQGEFQLREYSAFVVAETLVNSNFDKAGREALNRLFAYISGDNIKSQEISMTAPVMANRDEGDSQKIAMTAPVITQKQSSSWRYYFVLPKEISLSSAPKPINSDVIIKEIPSKLVAVIQYTGLWNEDTFNEKAKQLDLWIAENNLESVSLHSFAGYDPPWTLPFLRRNEVLIDVK